MSIGWTHMSPDAVAVLEFIRSHDDWVPASQIGREFGHLSTQQRGGIIQRLRGYGYIERKGCSGSHKVQYRARR